MPRVDSLEFQRNIGGFLYQAQREPVEITRPGRREFVLMSADQYDWLKAASQRTQLRVDAANVVVDALEGAEMDPEHAVLNDLLMGTNDTMLPAQSPACHSLGVTSGHARPPLAGIRTKGSSDLPRRCDRCSAPARL